MKTLQRWGVLPLTLVAAGGTACDADFVELRSPEAIALSRADAGFLIRDVGLADSGGFADPGPGDAGGGTGADAEPGSGDETVLRRGTWAGRAGYRASGGVTLVRRSDGEIELRFGDDFSVSRVPGPVVVLSFRDTLSGGIDPAAGDIDLGALEDERGAQVYPIPLGLDDRDYVWVYCRPFSVEIGRARLEMQ